uniref:Uncharacterized protein n=1 Tax=Colobus angolensis palliatus TaxID=336983 RepID=A0A2K5JJB7_COLAP
MVLDLWAQGYDQAPPNLPTSLPSLRHRLKPSHRDGPPLYPWSQPLASPLALAVPPALQPQPEQQPFSQMHLGHCGHMRRSDSTYSVNSTGCLARGTLGWPLPGWGQNPAGGTLWPAASLPHIAKTQRDAGHSASKSPCMLVALRPNNTDRKRDKFFQSRYTYNSHFEYQEPMPTPVLEKYCEASGQFIHQAVGITELFWRSCHREAAAHKCQIWSMVHKDMRKKGCVEETVAQLSEDLLSPAVMMVENSRSTLAINLTGARQYWWEGKLRHELGQDIRYLRGVNDARQPWHNAEDWLRYGLRYGEPGQPQAALPVVWCAALLLCTTPLFYYTLRALRMSFRQLCQDLACYVQDADVRREDCDGVRAQRGQTDTPLPGCFRKGQVYLDGIVSILRHRQTIDFPLLTSLGKGSCEYVDRLRPHGVLDNTRVPHFMQNLAPSRQQLEHIMATNRLDEAELGRLLPD